MTLRSVAVTLVFGICVAACASDTGTASDLGVGDASTDAGLPDDGVTLDSGEADLGVADAGGDTWANYAQAFAATYCVDCHAGPPSGRDFRTIADVRRDATLIRCGVSTTVLVGCDTDSPSPRQFPIGSGPIPSDADRARFVAWLDSGAPE